MFMKEEPEFAPRNSVYFIHKVSYIENIICGYCKDGKIFLKDEEFTCFKCDGALMYAQRKEQNKVSKGVIKEVEILWSRKANKNEFKINYKIEERGGRYLSPQVLTVPESKCFTTQDEAVDSKIEADK